MDKAEYLDLHKKYVGTYIQYRLNGTKEWLTLYVDVIQIQEEPVEYSYIVAGKNNKKEFINAASTEYEFNFSFPPLGVLSYKNTVAIGWKYPARQWKKAVTPENYKVFLPLQNIIEKISNSFLLPKTFTKVLQWGVADVHEWFNTKYSKYNEALALLKNNKKQAVALSEQFFITASHYKEGFLIWRFTKPIAEVSLGGTITYICKSFEQELKDYFTRNKDA